MKYIVSLIFSTLALFGFGECDTCVEVPFSVSVDLSKKGSVYETDFHAPWNIWGSLVEFYIDASYFINSNIKSHSQLTKEQEAISNSILHGLPQNSAKDIPYFKIKITLTPLGWASDNVTVMSNLNNGLPSRKEKHYTKGQKIEEIASVPLYGGNDGYKKTLIIADLQRLRNYHVRVESLEDVELPQGVHTNFNINRFSSKH